MCAACNITKYFIHLTVYRLELSENTLTFNTKMDLPIYLDIFKIKRVEVKTYFLKIEPVVCLNFITKIYGHENIFTISYDRFIGNVLDNFISATSLMKRSPDKPLTLMNELIPGGLTCNLIKPPYNRTFMDLR